MTRTRRKLIFTEKLLPEITVLPCPIKQGNNLIIIICKFITGNSDCMANELSLLSHHGFSVQNAYLTRRMYVHLC